MVVVVVIIVVVMMSRKEKERYIISSELHIVDKLKLTRDHHIHHSHRDHSLRDRSLHGVHDRAREKLKNIFFS